eukprot:Nk52_evm6s249 gene=Nk52_evmTU6s249
MRFVFPIFLLGVCLLCWHYNTIDSTGALHGCLSTDEAITILKEKQIFKAPSPSGDDHICPRIVLKDDSYFTQCQELDNVKAGLFVASHGANSSRAHGATGFRIRAFHPIAKQDIHHFKANFTNCGSSLSYKVFDIAGFGSNASSTNNVTTSQPGSPFSPLVDFYVPFAQPGFAQECATPNNTATDMPKSLSASETVTLRFTGWLNDDQRGLIGAKGTDVHFYIGKVKSMGGDGKSGLSMTVSFQTSLPSSSPKTLGTFDISPDDEGKMLTVEIPDLLKVEGCYANMLTIQVESQNLDASVSFDRIEAEGRPTVPIKRDTLYATNKQVVEASYEDFWYRYPSLLCTKVTGGEEDCSSSFSAFSQLRHDNFIDQLVQTFVMYEDGNIRIVPYPSGDFLQIPFGASFVFGKMANYTDSRPVQPVRHFNITSFTSSGFKASIVYKAPRVEDSEDTRFDYTVDVEVQSNEEETVVSFTNIPELLSEGAPIGVFRSMTVETGTFPALSDIDTAIGWKGDDPKRYSSSSSSLTFPSPGSSLEGDQIAFVKKCPSLHNSDAPGFVVELIC